MASLFSSSLSFSYISKPPHKPKHLPLMSGEAMVNSIAPLPLLEKLSGYVNHDNHRVRAKADVSISVSKMGVEEINEFGLVTMLRMATDLLNDRLSETKEAARSIVFSVYNKAFTANEDETLEEACQSFS